MNLFLQLCALSPVWAGEPGISIKHGVRLVLVVDARAASEGMGPVLEARLHGPGGLGPPLLVRVADDGQPPDPRPGDGVFHGHAWEELSPGAVEMTLSDAAGAILWKGTIDLSDARTPQVEVVLGSGQPKVEVLDFEDRSARPAARDARPPPGLATEVTVRSEGVGSPWFVRSDQGRKPGFLDALPPLGVGFGLGLIPPALLRWWRDRRARTMWSATGNATGVASTRPPSLAVRGVLAVPAHLGIERASVLVCRQRRHAGVVLVAPAAFLRTRLQNELGNLPFMVWMASAEPTVADLRRAAIRLLSIGPTTLVVVGLKAIDAELPGEELRELLTNAPRGLSVMVLVTEREMTSGRFPEDVMLRGPWDIGGQDLGAPVSEESAS